MKVKYNKKYVKEVEKFIGTIYGKIDTIAVLDREDFKFELLHILPTDAVPYNILVTAGISAIKPRIAPDKVLGNEFLMFLPKDWTLPSEVDYADGFVLNIFQSLADILLDGGAILPGSTIRFDHLKNGSQHNAIVVDLPCNKECSLSLRKGDIVFFEIQTAHKDEYPLLAKDDEVLLKKIMNLPCVDTQRESLV